MRVALLVVGMLIGCLVLAWDARAQDIARPVKPAGQNSAAPSPAPLGPARPAPVDVAPSNTNTALQDAAKTVKPPAPVTAPRVPNDPEEDASPVDRALKNLTQTFVLKDRRYFDLTPPVRKGEYPLTLRLSGVQLGKDEQQYLSTLTGYQPAALVKQCNVILEGIATAVGPDNKQRILSLRQRVGADLVTGYKGALSSVSVTPSVLCKKPAVMSSNAGVVTQIGDSILLPLTDFTADVQPYQPKSKGGPVVLTVSYAGNGKLSVTE